LKELGQHFLVDEEVAARIVAALELRWEERAMEIGPGRGVLLRFLLKAGSRITAVEVDPRMLRTLERVFGGHPGLNLVHQDFMQFDLAGWLESDPAPARIVGNLPYYLSSPIIFRLFEAAGELARNDRFPLTTAVLMLQKEVAQRLAASPGGRDYGAMTVFRALVAEAELLFTVPPDAFLPPPKVTSAVARLRFHSRRRYDIPDPALFGQLVHHVFAQRRKMLKNTLGTFPWARPGWERTPDFDFTRRPEELGVEEFIKLYQLVVEKNASPTPSQE